MSASPAQVQYLRDLATTRAIFGTQVSRAETMAKVEQSIADGLTGDSASALITAGVQAVRHPADQVPATRHEIDRVRAYAADYALFGLTVTVEDTLARVEEAINGTFFSSAHARDLIRLGYSAPPHPTAQTPLRLRDIEGIDGLDVSEGHYAVFDDKDVLRFYRIYTPSTGANKDEGVIRRFAGDTLMGLYPDEARLVLYAIDADPDSAAYRFSDTFTRCWVCGKNLTDSVSRLLSVGPTCRGFVNHTGLRHAANDVDHNTERRAVYRALREWALGRGFKDPRNREERATATMTASRVASAWSGIPGVLGLSPDEAVRVVNAALTDDVTPDIKDGLLNGPKDTLLILVESGVLSSSVMNILAEHTNPAVRGAVNEFFLTQLGM